MFIFTVLYGVVDAALILEFDLVLVQYEGFFGLTEKYLSLLEVLPHCLGALGVSWGCLLFPFVVRAICFLF